MLIVARGFNLYKWKSNPKNIFNKIAEAELKMMGSNQANLTECYSLYISSNACMHKDWIYPNSLVFPGTIMSLL